MTTHAKRYAGARHGASMGPTPAEQRAMDYDKAMHDALTHFRGSKRYDGPLVAAAGYAEAARAARAQHQGVSVSHPHLSRAQVERFYDMDQ